MTIAMNTGMAIANINARVDRVILALLGDDHAGPLEFRFKDAGQLRRFIEKVLVIGNIKAATGRQPANAPHPSVFIQDELTARGWDRNMLATRMVCMIDSEAWKVDVEIGDDEKWGITRLSIDMYFDIGPNKPNMRIGTNMAAEFGKAFGVSAKFFLNLERYWLAGQPKETT